MKREKIIKLFLKYNLNITIMKKTLLSLLAFALSLGMSAQGIMPFNGKIMQNPNPTAKTVTKASPKKADLNVNQRYVGYYTTDELNKNGNGIPQIATGDLRVGTLIAYDILNEYIGKKIVGVRFGLKRSVGNTNFTINPIVNGYITDPVFSKNVESAAGWNYVTLDNPITIEEGNAFLLSFNYYQTDKNDGTYYDDECFPLSAVNTDYDGIGSPLMFYLNIPEDEGGYGENWYTFNGGAVSIQLIVEGDFPEYTATTSDFKTFTGMKDAVNTVDLRFLNSSKEAVSNLDYVVSINGNATDEQHVELGSPVARNAYGTFTANIPAISETGTQNIVIELTKLNGNKNEASERYSTGKINIASEVYDKNLVIEELGTESTEMYPTISQMVQTAVDKADKSRVFIVSHHTGDSSDWLSRTWDTDLASVLFGEDGTFAPTMAFNRDENVVADNEYKTGVFGVYTTVGEYSSTINSVLKEKANAKLTSLSAVSDGSNMTVTVKGKCNEAYDKNSARVTFYLTENNIKARSQKGATGTFYHNYVIRANNSSWGESVDWKGNEFTATFNTSLKNAWDPDQMNIVAFLNKYNATVYSDNAIENSIGASYYDATSGISNAISDNAGTKEVARYTLDGTRVSAPVKGLNIVKMNDGRIVKVMVK